MTYKKDITDSSETILTPITEMPIPAADFYNTKGEKVDHLILENLSSGKVIDKRYQLIEHIGSGGMAVVWKALDILQDHVGASECHVAIKFIDTQFNEDMLANAVREANRTRTLKHHNIISIFSMGKTGGLLFIVMELLHGTTLKKFITEAKQKNNQQNSFIMPYEQAMSLSHQITQAMAYAHKSDEHKKGILHLDLKPENIFYNPENGVIKIFDFGLARYVKKEDDEKTVYKGIEGLTKKYASPEALERYDPDNESHYSRILEAGIGDDIYSLACIIYEIFSGKKPFGSLDALQAKEANKQVTPLKIKPNQWQVLAKALAFERKNRTLNLDIFLNDFFNTNINKKSFLFISIPKLIVFFCLMGYFMVTLIEKPKKEEEEEIKTSPFPIITPPSPIVIAPIPITIFKFWILVNNKNRKEMILHENSPNFIENINIGDKIKIHFSTNEKVYVTFVYVDSNLKKFVKTLPCCDKNNAYILFDKKPMEVTMPIGIDKVRILISKQVIRNDWISLNNKGEINEENIKNNLIDKMNTIPPFFINGKLDLLIKK